MKYRRWKLLLCATTFWFCGVAVGAPPLIIKTAQFPRPKVPPLGINLEPVLDWAHSMMFVDMIKSARKFGSATAPWDGNATVDANGWPTGDAGTVVAADTPVPQGDYLFSCTGRCDVVPVACPATVQLQAYDRDKNVTTATVRVPANCNLLFLGFKNTSGGVRDIRLLRPGYGRDTKQIFSKDFLDAIAPFSTLRLMQYLRTNQTDVTEWKQRSKVTDALQSSKRGAAWEYAIDLANETHKDLWINVPTRASDDYVKQLATLIKSKLDKKLVVYVEYSNELWNGMFPQFQVNLKAARAEVKAGDKTLSLGGTNQNIYYWSWRRVGKRTVDISNIFKAVYADNPAAINTVIRPVLAAQAVQPFMLRTQLEYIERYDGPPAKFIYGVAEAPYFAAPKSVSEADGLTVDEMLKSAEDTGLAEDRSYMLQYQLVARYYRVHSLCYEGGPAFDGEKNVDVKIAASRDPRMEGIIRQYLTDWYQTGGGLFMYFNLAGSYGKYGCWGLTEDIRKKTSKTAAIMDILQAPPPPVTVGIALPATVPALDFTGHRGGGPKKVDDGTQFLTYINDGSRFDYLVNVQSAGDYAFTLQTAAPSEGASVEVLLSGDSLGKIPIKNTGSWMTWSDSAPVALRLEKGQLTLCIKIIKAGLNIKSFTFQKK